MICNIISILYISSRSRLENHRPKHDPISSTSSMRSSHGVHHNAISVSVRWCIRKGKLNHDTSTGALLLHCFCCSHVHTIYTIQHIYINKLLLYISILQSHGIAEERRCGPRGISFAFVHSSAHRPTTQVLALVLNSLTTICNAWLE